MNTYLHISSMTARHSHSKYKYIRSKLLPFTPHPQYPCTCTPGGDRV